MSASTLCVTSKYANLVIVAHCFVSCCVGGAGQCVPRVSSVCVCVETLQANNNQKPTVAHANRTKRNERERATKTCERAGKERQRRGSSIQTTHEKHEAVSDEQKHNAHQIQARKCSIEMMHRSMMESSWHAINHVGNRRIMLSSC